MQTLVSPLWFHSLALLRLFRSGRAELRLSEMIKGYSVISYGRYNWVFYAVLRTSKQRDERWWEMKATFSELHNLIRDKRGRLIPPLPESKCNINLLLLSPLFCALPLLRYHMCLWMLYKSHEGRFYLDYGYFSALLSINCSDSWLTLSLYSTSKYEYTNVSSVWINHSCSVVASAHLKT